MKMASCVVMLTLLLIESVAGADHTGSGRRWSDDDRNAYEQLCGICTEKTLLEMETTNGTTECNTNLFCVVRV